MKKIASFLVCFLGVFSTYAQFSDRIGFVNSSEVVPNKGFQIESGYLANSLDYAGPRLVTSVNTLLRKGSSEIHEFRFGYDYELKEDNLEYNYEWFTLGVKLKVANYEKLKIASIATWGFDLRTITRLEEPIYYLQLEVPAEYHFTESLSAQAELRFNHLFEQSDFNIALKKKVGEHINLLPGFANSFFLVERGDHGDKPQWAELSYATLAVEARVNDNFTLDIGGLFNILTGKNQLDPAEGLVIQGGISYRFTSNQ